MINTLDLSADMAFYEARNQPWTLRNLLDQFAARHSYVDRLNRPAEQRRGGELGYIRDPQLVKELIAPPVERDLPGGISFTHDMGVAGQFTPAGTSSYEIAGVIGCFSFMTAEQLVNRILIAQQPTCSSAATRMAGRAGYRCSRVASRRRKIAMTQNPRAAMG